MQVKTGTIMTLKNMNDVNFSLVESVGASWLPRSLGNTLFHVANIMLHLLQMKGLFGRLADEVPNDNATILWTCVDPL